jgi:hypothetical protein
MLLIFLKSVDFHPRLGVVTHTLAVAMNDIAHFFVVLAVVFAVYSALGHIILGGQLEAGPWQSLPATLFTTQCTGARQVIQ